MLFPTHWTAFLSASPSKQSPPRAASYSFLFFFSSYSFLTLPLSPQHEASHKGGLDNYLLNSVSNHYKRDTHKLVGIYLPVSWLHSSLPSYVYPCHSVPHVCAPIPLEVGGDGRNSHANPCPVSRGLQPGFDRLSALCPHAQSLQLGSLFNYLWPDNSPSPHPREKRSTFPNREVLSQWVGPDPGRPGLGGVIPEHPQIHMHTRC